VAAWFACHERHNSDGTIWWFNFERLEEEVGEHWDEFGVPYRDLSHAYDGWSEEERRERKVAERRIEATAFATTGHPWITKLHFFYPCARMEAQQGFHTVAGRLRLSHCDAINDLARRSTKGDIPAGDGRFQPRSKTMF
jgi:hypothetical protein